MEDGEAVLRTVTEKPIQLVDKILEPLAGEVSRTVKTVFELEGQPVSIIAGRETFSVAMLDHLHLNCQWRVSGGMLLPTFLDANDLRTEYPAMKLRWDRPGTMALAFVCRISHDKNNCSTTGDGCYLLAFNGSGNCFLPPLPNLYEDGKLCLGAFNGVGGSLMVATQRAYAQLGNSRWNTDLLGDRHEKAEALFSLNITKDSEGKDVFTTRAVTDWEDHCAKCETAVTNLVRSLVK